METGRKRLLLVSPLPPPLGGISTWTEGVLGSSLAQRFETKVVDSAPSASRGVDARSRLRPSRIFDSIRILRDLVGALLRFRPQVVHVSSSYHWALVRDGIVLWLAKRSGARTVLHLHGGDFPEFVRSVPRPVRGLIDASLRRADRLIVLTEHSRAFLAERLGAAKVRLVPNFVVLDDLPLPPDRTQRSERPLEILYAGWLIEAKGIRELLEAARMLPELRFTLIGPAERDFVESIQTELAPLRGRLRLLDPLPRAQLTEHYHRCDVFVLPSHREGFPNVILEAMAAGLPVVATSVGAIPEIVRDGEEGCLIPVKNAPALVEALRRLLGDRGARIALGARGRQRVESLYERSEVLQQLEAVYLELVAG